MKKIVYLVLSIIVSQFVISCNRILLETLVIKKSAIIRKKILYNPENQTTIIYIPMTHINKPEFYAEVKSYLDSLRKENFIVFYEGIRMDTAKININVATMDTLKRKLRVVTGINLTNYKNPDNKSIPKLIRNRKIYIDQTNENTGISRSTDIKADIPLNELIAKYEAEYGKIELTDCDFSTPLMEKYKCRNPKKYSAYHMLRTIRDKHLTYVVDTCQAKKKVVIFGASHWWSFYPYFRDKGYILKEGKI